MEQVTPEAIGDNPFQLIGSDWMLITGGDIESFNTMTASWGGLGVLWNRDVCFVFVRPTRFTYQFMERRDVFSLSFFEERYREVLNFCGTKSGREVDKVEATGLTPVGDPTGAVYFEEARLVLICRKIYFQDILPAQFLDPTIDGNYPKKDYHRMYVGQVLKAYQK